MSEIVKKTDLVTELRKFGSLTIEGFGSEEMAAEKLSQLNDIIAAEPKVLSAITDPGNIKAFEELKAIIGKKGSFMTKIPELVTIAKKFKI